MPTNTTTPDADKAPETETEILIPCEVYSRIVGYLRPIQNWNKGKVQEFADRKTYRMPTDATRRHHQTPQVAAPHVDGVRHQPRRDSEGAAVVQVEPSVARAHAAQAGGV